MRRLPPTLLAAALALVLTACGETHGMGIIQAPAAPLALSGTAYDVAMRTTLPSREPEDGPGLHQIYRLSDNIVSGAEPHGDVALKALADMGIKTILSVDGKTPDAETARKYGLRYVHIPIQYSGISTEQIEKIVKTFREQQGPFFVHCFHGKHRGPAGAALGRLVLDGASREQALAEMAQWCGAAAKYEGLYRTIATAEMPSEARTKKVAFAFDEAHPFEGIRAGMIQLTRTWDNLELLAKGDFQPDKEHPDLDAANEAAQAKHLFAQMLASHELLSKPKDYQAWMKSSAEHAVALHDALYGTDTGSAEALARAKKHFGAIQQDCAACHKAHRNTDD